MAKSAILRISTAVLLTLGAASAQACATGHQWGSAYPYGYERRGAFEQRAFDNGVRDGYDRGIDDLRHHRSPDIDRQKRYRHADRDYDHHYGPREAYRVEYRRGFEQGYDRAYREGWRGDWRR